MIQWVALLCINKVVSVKMGQEFVLFLDEFESLDNWQFDVTLGGAGNREFEAYTARKENAYVKDGVLYIKPTLTSDAVGLNAMSSGVMDLRGEGCASLNEDDCVRVATPQNVLPPVFSAKMSTRYSFGFKYGRVEFRAKLPSGDWLWPALWMMSMNEAYGPWPSSGEIDIMEARGNGIKYVGLHGEPLGNNRFSSCMHWGPAWNRDGYPLSCEQSQPLPNNTSFHDDFHIFGLYWTDKELYTYVDSPEQKLVQVQFYDKTSFYDVGVQANLWDNTTHNCYSGADITAPFNDKFFLIMNVAVGGCSLGQPHTIFETGYWIENLGSKPWHNFEPYPHTSFFEARDQWYPTWNGEDAAMQIDSVKVWGIRGLTTWHKSLSAVGSRTHGYPLRAKFTFASGLFGGVLALAAIFLGVSCPEFSRIVSFSKKKLLLAPSRTTTYTKIQLEETAKSAT